MTIKRNKFKCLILMLGALLTLGLQPLLVQANTTDVDSHFSVEMVETSDSKVGGEAVQVTVKNITNQTGNHIVAKVDLPKNFADKLGKTSVTETVGTLAAGESKSFIISLSDGSTQVLPITGTSLPITGERVASLALIVGLVLLMSLGIILRKRKLTSLLFALLVITGGSVADASTTYHHAVTQTHQVTVVGQTSVFKTHVSGDFGSTENGNPSDDKPIPTKYTVAFDLNYQTTETVPSQEVVANELAIQPTAPTRIGYNFEGWYENDAVTAFDFSTPIQKDITLYAKWEEAPIARVHFKNYDGTEEVLPDQKIYAANPNLAIPDAPKEDYCFLGWAESASAGKTATLYVPSTYTDVRSTLNDPDQTYLGYTVKTEHELTGIAADTTLYAVYYKAKDAVTTAGDEFIWANAIWRNLKTDMDTTIPGNQALVIKVNALTASEATGSGATTGYYLAKFLESQTTYFSSTGENGYEAADNNVRLANTTYYNSLSTEDKTSVNKVALNNPSFAEFKDSISFTAGSTYSNWQWNNFYKDTRFKTTVSEAGSKQAFALSYGDIHTIDGVGADDSITTKLDLDGAVSTSNYYWLRSAGGGYNCASFVSTGDFSRNILVSFPRTVRPALSIQIN